MPIPANWMWPWASVYSAQVAIGMLIWAIMDPRGGGLLVGGIALLPFAALTVALWMAKDHFGESGDGPQARERELTGETE